ncbi:thioredoxin-like protein [Mycena galopus ATCC 62051]|nr:thioredoxin-like protein [Mycena galopus ATCC 62051]
MSETFTVGESKLGSSAIVEITSLDQLAGVLGTGSKLPGSKASVLSFCQPSCPPCRAMKPHFEALSESYGAQMNFLTCDISVVREVADAYKVTAVPTYVFFKGDMQMEKIVSDSKLVLRDAVLKFSGTRRYSGSF